MKEIYKSCEDKMKKSVDVLSKDLSAIRAGRANPAVLDKISIDYYGAPTPINQIGSVSAPEARVLVVQPWDVSALGLIEKALQGADLGINPQNDGKVIRLNFPPLTEERRKELIKQVSRLGEDCKVSIRNIRRDSIDKLKDMKKKSEITEDDLKSAEKSMQDYTDKYCKEVDSVVAGKEKELAGI